MKIRRLNDLAGARAATGVTVIIDIYRAASVVAYAFGAGARHVIPVATKEEAFALKKLNPQYLLMGEEEGIPIPGFDFGNSPHEISRAAVKNKVLVHRSTRGTQGLVLATGASEIIFGSFPVAGSIVSFIKKTNPAEVSIVAMDPGDTEDEVFAQYLENRLTGQTVDDAGVKQLLLNHTESTLYRKEDLELALTFDSFDFIPLLVKKDKEIKLKKVKVRHT